MEFLGILVLLQLLQEDKNQEDAAAPAPEDVLEVALKLETVLASLGGHLGAPGPRVAIVGVRGQEPDAATRPVVGPVLEVALNLVTARTSLDVVVGPAVVTTAFSSLALSRFSEIK